MEREGRREERSDDRQVVGPPGSFDAFYRREVRAVLAVTMGLTRHRWEAEEVTQEAFYRAYRDWDRVGRMDHPGAWTRRVALNLAVGRWRRLKAEARAVMRLAPSRDEPPPPEPEADRFWDEVRALPDRQAQVVALTYVEDLDADAVGDILGIAASTVRVHLSRARATLARRLEVEE
ncbi:MAG: sigma-70 family RNA polymerase sigma factor [Actinomycetota bacterium]|nr:sigma-70 family RNA polymerase sigma factor [Actinomycetota bacterium]